jgi:hypothetical protein
MIAVDMSSPLHEHGDMASAGKRRDAGNARREQLRHAKRAQREREKLAGFVNVQLVLPKATAARLSIVRRQPDFPTWLDSVLDQFVVRIADFPQLRDLAWNRADEFITAREAFQLYERNWRFVEPERLEPHERALLDRLKDQFGRGVLLV